jgi:hypothetical protein
MRISTALFSVLLVASGCDKSVTALSADGGAGKGSGGGSAGAGGGSSTTGGGGSSYDGPTLGTDANGKIPLGQTQCSDGIDNDGDGLIDLADPECVGPLDNDESSFATGIPGDNVDPCKQDCFFDGNSGMGDDGCQWQLKCDPLSTEAKCPYDSSYASQHTSECSASMSQSQFCIDHCTPLVPNGCDCFGCCLIPGAPNAIRLAATCTAADFGDPTKCPPCTQVTQCANTCEHCELCIGKTTLPADCAPDAGGTPVPTCGQYQACGTATGPDAVVCPANTGCITGCCIPLTIVP